MIRLRWPRFSVRVAMGGVAVVALLASLWARDLAGRRRSYLEAAAWHGRQEAQELRTVAAFDGRRRDGETGRNVPGFLAIEQAARLQAAFHAESRRELEKAAGLPPSASPRIPEDSAPGEITGNRERPARSPIPGIEAEYPSRSGSPASGPVSIREGRRRVRPPAEPAGPLPHPSVPDINPTGPTP